MLQRVGRILEHQRFTGTACGAGVVQLHLVVHVGAGDRLRQIFVDRVGDECLPGGSQARHASRVDVPGVVLGVDVDALVAQQEVPHGFGAGLRDRERHTWQYVIDGQAAFQRLGAGGVLAAVFQHGLRQHDGAVGRVDIDAVGGKALGQLHRSGSEHALVLVDVLAIDHQHRLFAGKWIGAHAVARLEAGWRGGQATVVGWNRTVGIGSLLCADLGQAAAQLGSLLLGYGGLCLGGKHHGHGGGQQRLHEFHLVVLLLSR
ncbi:hypothetical protein D9M71_409720 [compost metagenome]